MHAGGTTGEDDAPPAPDPGATRPGAAPGAGADSARGAAPGAGAVSSSGSAPGGGEASAPGAAPGTGEASTPMAAPGTGAASTSGAAPAVGAVPSSGRAPAGGPAEREFLALERELAVFLRRARAQSGEMAREVHPELESSAYGLFVRLDDAGPQRATELSAYFGVGKATMSRQLRALEQLGLVARDPDPADGRASLVRLTDEGRDRFRHVRDARRERYVRKLADWDRAEVAELARLLHHFNQRSEG